MSQHASEIFTGSLGLLLNAAAFKILKKFLQQLETEHNYKDEWNNFAVLLPDIDLTIAAPGPFSKSFNPGHITAVQLYLKLLEIIRITLDSELTKLNDHLNGLAQKIVGLEVYIKAQVAIYLKDTHGILDTLPISLGVQKKSITNNLHGLAVALDTCNQYYEILPEETQTNIDELNAQLESLYNLNDDRTRHQKRYNDWQKALPRSIKTAKSATDLLQEMMRWQCSMPPQESTLNCQKIFQHFPKTTALIEQHSELLINIALNYIEFIMQQPEHEQRQLLPRFMNLDETFQSAREKMGSFSNKVIFPESIITGIYYHFLTFTKSWPAIKAANEEEAASTADESEACGYSSGLFLALPLSASPTPSSSTPSPTTLSPSTFSSC